MGWGTWYLASDTSLFFYLSDVKKQLNANGFFLSLRMSLQSDEEQKRS